MNFGKIFRVFGVAVGGLASSTVLASPSPPIYQVIRGQYEDKIRRYSPPEKIFQVFATWDESSACNMQLYELLRAICFYNYSQTDDEKIKSFESQYIPILLGRADNKYDIYDYFNFVRVLTYPREKVRQYFQEHNIDKMTKDQFMDFILFTVCKDYDEFIREPIYIESRSFAPKKEEFMAAVRRMADSLFNYREKFSFQEFVNFRVNILKQVFAFEFRTFKDVNGAIDGVDFARSIVKYAENNHKRLLLKRIFAIEPQIQNYKITEQDYVNFHVQLRIKHNIIQSTLNKKGAMSYQDIVKLFNEHTDKINQNQLKIFFRLLDSDDSEFIEKREVLGVITQLCYYWQTKPGENSTSQIAKKRWESFVSKFKRILDIMAEE